MADPTTTMADAAPTSKSHAPQLLRFAPFLSTAPPTFWTHLASLKVDRLKLDDAPIPVRAHYTTGRSVVAAASSSSSSVAAGDGGGGGGGGILTPLPPTLALQPESLTTTTTTTTSPPSSSSHPHPTAVPPPPWTCEYTGHLKNFNTLEEFRDADKQALFDQRAEQVLRDMLCDDDELVARSVSTFLLLCFADLKKYRFYHWLAVPALVARPSWHVEAARVESAVHVLGRRRAAVVHSLLRSRFHDANVPAYRRGFFLVRTKTTKSTATAPRGVATDDEADGVDAGGGADEVEVGDVTDYTRFFADVPPDQRTVGFVDPCASEDAFGWPLRNLLSLLAIRFGVRSVRVLAWRDELASAAPTTAAITKEGGDAVRRSRVFRATLPEEDGVEGKVEGPRGVNLPIAADVRRGLNRPSAVGWERNASGKLAPKLADLGPLMDPKRLADQAVDLNLKLMRWRIMPDIDLEAVREARCLLLGAGTLGCYVARTLMGWGVRHITFVDSSRVSYSNPVRQPLFTFDDCLEGGAPKAQRAAEALRRVYPNVAARGEMLAVPMPGHAVGESESAKRQCRADVERLEALVEEHDVIYLLMDSRESRWLPTLLGAAKGKLVINAALGFDTYLVMRHGGPPEELTQTTAGATTTGAADMGLPMGGTRLGCYFCNDVVAPADSLSDRTLDQMCTVTRPGLAAIAGASAVELMVSVLQHRLGIHAPAPDATTNSSGEAADASSPSSCCLGVVPHQLRGFLSRFSTSSVGARAFDRCTACSWRVVRAYRERGFAMLLEAFNDARGRRDGGAAGQGDEESGFLERLSGLDELKREARKVEEALELDWSEEEEEEAQDV